jgi:HTH-type transcriptional regulator/antitoxin HigA
MRRVVILKTELTKVVTLKTHVERVMQSFNLNQTITAWSFIGENVFVPHTEEEYERLVEMLDHLIDQVGEDESHPLASLMEVIGVLIENYETENIPQIEEIV